MSENTTPEAPDQTSAQHEELQGLSPVAQAALEAIHERLEVGVEYHHSWIGEGTEEEQWAALLAQSGEPEGIDELHAQYLRDRAVHPIYFDDDEGFWSQPLADLRWTHINESWRWSEGQSLWFSGPGARGLGLRMVHRLGPDGDVLGALHIRPDVSRSYMDEEAGKKRVVKFETPIGIGRTERIQRAYEPMQLMAWTGKRYSHEDGPVPAIITEGIVKGMAIESAFLRSGQDGLATIALAGVTMGYHAEAKGKPKHLSKDLAVIDWKRRPVIIAFDADWLVNKAVRNAILTTGQLLEAEGATVFVLRLDQEALGLDDAKAGIDDAIAHLLRRGDEAPMWTLLRTLVPLETLRDESKWFEPTDLGRGAHLADRLSAAGYCFVPGKKHPWMRYDRETGTWGSDAFNTELVKRKAYEVAEDRWSAELWNGSHSARGVAAAIEVARSLEQVTKRERDFDRHPHHLAVSNGVVDLRTGTLEEHAPEWLFTSAATGDYDPDSGPDVDTVWRAYLLDAMDGDEAMLRFLQVYFGTGLTGLPQERLAILIGSGGNGKGLLLNTIQRVLGEHATTLYSNALTGKLDARMTAHLRNRRLVVMQETRAGEKLDDGAVKILASADRVVGAKVFEEHSSWDPTHTAVLATNDIPRIAASQGGAAGNGLFRRLLVVPFTKTIAPEKRDEHLVARLATEHAGDVITWLINGARLYYADGLEAFIPEKVREATKQLRDDADTVGRFMRDCLVIDAGSTALRADKADIFRAYERWAIEEHLIVMTKQSFNKALIERGVRVDDESIVKSNGKRWVTGVGLLQEDSHRGY